MQSRFLPLNCNRINTHQHGVSLGKAVVWLAMLLLAASCSDKSLQPISIGFGSDPILPAPVKKLIPTINVAPAKGWPDGAKPEAAEGLTVDLFAADLEHPRWLYVLPNGDVLVAESNASTGGTGIKGWLARLIMSRAGAGVPSADRITLLRDDDGDGIVDQRSIFVDQLNSPFGMALVDDYFYLANTDALMRYSYEDGALQLTGQGVKVADLPAGNINYHWTKNFIAHADGTRVYVTVGSNSNVGENGMENEVNRAAILEIDLATVAVQTFASGLRNPNGLAWHPQTGELWVTVNERDELGDNLVPDYLTSVQAGGFYGWPYSYFGQNVDERVEPQNPDLVANAIVPDYALGAHTASLGLAFDVNKGLPNPFQGGAFIGQHGSWNREILSGYKVIFIPFSDGRPEGDPIDVLTGFIDDDGDAYGRPAGVALDSAGALLVADDVGNKIWRVMAQSAQ